jgi:chromate reductase, NAD(P)H dehydrogenase (quinone)
MKTHRIAVLVGSLREGSINRLLANAVIELAPKGFSFTSVRIDDLPPYNQDLEKDPGPAVTRLKQDIASAQGVLFVTPEYNRSVPGVLKNAIDHASRPYEQSAWEGKPAGVIGASVGAPGSSMAQQHLRNVLAYLDMPTLGQPEVYVQVTDGMFDKSGTLANDETRTFLSQWMEKYVAWVQAHVGSR